MAKTIGYMRVSTAGQSFNLQRDALKQQGCHKIYSDKISGAKEDRPGLDKCLEALEKGDTLVVWRLDRLGRSMSHLVNVVKDLRVLIPFYFR